ncbi:unnamed protein product, partial [Ilex paraguariensis]
NAKKGVQGSTSKKKRMGQENSEKTSTSKKGKADRVPAKDKLGSCLPTARAQTCTPLNVSVE